MEVGTCREGGGGCGGGESAGEEDAAGVDCAGFQYRSLEEIWIVYLPGRKPGWGPAMVRSSETRSSLSLLIEGEEERGMAGVDGGD